MNFRLGKSPPSRVACPDLVCYEMPASRGMNRKEAQEV